MSGYRFLSLAKRTLICLFLASLVAVSVQAYLLILDLRQSIKDGQAAAAQVARDTRETLAEWRQYTERMKVQIDDPKTQRGINLLLRSGDDLARTIKKANVVLEDLSNAIRDTSAHLNGRTLPGLDLAINRTADQINVETLPEIARTLQAATSATESARDAIQASSSELAQSLVGVRRSVESIEARINDPHLDAIITNIDAATAHASESLFHVEQATKRLTRPVHWFWRGLKSGAVVVGRVFVP